MVTTRDARAVAAEVRDPELPMLTVADLGVLREVTVSEAGAVTVTITPTYSGCPALETIRRQLHAALRAAGYHEVTVRTALSPPWTTAWISEEGRRALAEHGIAPPDDAGWQPAGPVALRLDSPRRHVRCPQCGSAETREQSPFGSTACKALYRCGACGEPFEYFKEF